MQTETSILKSGIDVRTTPDDFSEKSGRKKPWRPMTMRIPYLATLIAVTAGLIGVIQWLLYICRRDKGIIFAQDINELPLRKSFCYLYLPTIISVAYSFLWTWVDFDIKRLEPYYQISKPGGAPAARSILLVYPLEFLVTLPFIAFKHRHWIVMSASISMIMVFWGLTPTNSGMFATGILQMPRVVPGLRSTSYRALDDQGNLSTIYAQSVYNIAWLNESLPAFMTRDYVLSAFAPSTEVPPEATSTNYTGETTLYSIDITCNEAELVTFPDGSVKYKGAEDCVFHAPLYRPYGGNDTSKPYDTMYVGYRNEGGFADYYLSQTCDESFAHFFFVRWSKSNPDFILDENNTVGPLQAGQASATSLFCSPTYFQQDVSATISWPSNSVLDVRVIGEKRSLPGDLFGASAFEWAMSSGLAQFPPRGDFPMSGFPDQKARLESMPLNLEYLPKMAPFAIATYQKPLEEYLDPETLRLSYQSAYRLLFARQLVDVLGSELDPESETAGLLAYSTQALTVVPGFAYAATALLSLVFVIALGLLLTLPRRHCALEQDPATIGNLMDLVSKDIATVNSFTDLDILNDKDLRDSIQDHFCYLRPEGDHERIRLSIEEKDNSSDRETSSHEGSLKTRGGELKAIPRLRPTEMKLPIGAVFLIIHIAAATILMVLYIQAKYHKGLPIPSQSTFVRQLVENYIPILIATFMEPFWLVLSRLLCLLHPFEELRRGNAAASRSIDVDYNSLPPQILFWRAFRARNFVMVLVCMMVLAANILAVSLSGTMYEGQEMIQKPAVFHSTHAAKFRSLNGTSQPFNTEQQTTNQQGGTTSDPFYRAMSNLTAHTPLPPWTDERYSYLAMNATTDTPETKVQIPTLAFGADLQCQPLLVEGASNYTLSFLDYDSAAYANIVVNLQADNGQTIPCNGPMEHAQLKNAAAGHAALELGMMLTSNTSVADDLFCRQHVLMAWLRVDWVGIENNPDVTMKVASHNETVLLCKPKLIFGPAEVIVDSAGHVQELLSANTTSESLESYFATSPADLLAQANQFLIDSNAGRTFHTDAYPSDFINYLIRQHANDTSLLDFSLPVPDPALAAQRLSDVYAMLFAILVATNQDLLLEEPSPDDAPIAGWTLQPHTRILFSTPAFIVSEVILICYIAVTILLYARRPWKVLPRLPSSPASIIAYFAASRALSELGAMGPEESERTRARWTWGYGTFVGWDGEAHVGVEREPFVVVPRKEWLRKRKWYTMAAREDGST